MAASPLDDRPPVRHRARPDRSGPYGTIALGSLVALGVELFLGFGLGFAPGWANNWMDGRLSIHQVWSVGMTAILFAIVVTATIGLGAVCGLVLGRMARSRPYASLAFWLCLLAGAVGALGMAPSVRRSIHAEALTMWPNGYNP